MPQALERCLTRFRAKSFRAECLLAVSAILSFGVYALEAEGGGALVSASPNPVTNEEKNNPRPKYSADDPIFGFITRVNAEDDNDANATVVDVGETDVVQTKGRWARPNEEAGTSPVRIASTTRPEDPEWRHLPSGDLDDVSWTSVSKSKLSAPSAARLGDPESRFRITQSEDQAPLGLDIRRRSRRQQYVLSDSVRFSSGQGLDSDASELAADMMLAEKKAAEEPREIEPPPVATVIPKPTTTSKPNKTQTPPAVVDSLSKLMANGPAAAADPKTKGKGKPEPVDPEQRFEALKAQIEENRKLIARNKETAPEKSVQVGEGEEVRVRDARAAKAIKVLLENTPLGTLTGTVADGSGKFFVPARVRVLDATDTEVEAPLPQGFWCDGRFSVPVISGAVRVEVSAGRFRAQMMQGVQVKPQGATPFETQITCPPALNFASRGWYLADLDLPLRVQPGQRSVWMKGRPAIDDLILAARAEGVQIIGVPLPADDPETALQIEKAVGKDPNVLVIPSFAGPDHVFQGKILSLGLGSEPTQGIAREITVPEVSMHEVLDEIRARGGLSILKDFAGGKSIDIKRDIVPLFPRLQLNRYYPESATTARLYSAVEFPFQTIVGPSYDTFAFDGSEAMERVWFNLLNQGYKITPVGAGGGSFEGGRIPYGQTFIQLEKPPTRDNVLQAIRAGKTSISFGPVALCKILERDKGPGSVLPADGRHLTLQIQAYSSMLAGMQLDRIDIIRNGQIIHTQAATEGETQINNFAWNIAETGTAWYVVRVTERRNTAGAPVKGGTAWSSPIYFHGVGYAAPEPATSKVFGTLRQGLTPLAGTVTAVVAGQQPKQIATDASGKFEVDLPASGALLFEAPGCEPQVYRVVEHPKIQKALGALSSLSQAEFFEQISKSSILTSWRLLVSELPWDITLVPAADTGKKSGD